MPWRSLSSSTPAGGTRIYTEINSTAIHIHKQTLRDRRRRAHNQPPPPPPFPCIRLCRSSAPSRSARRRWRRRRLWRQRRRRRRWRRRWWWWWRERENTAMSAWVCELWLAVCLAVCISESTGSVVLPSYLSARRCDWCRAMSGIQQLLPRQSVGWGHQRAAGATSLRPSLVCSVRLAPTRLD